MYIEIKKIISESSFFMTMTHNFKIQKMNKINKRWCSGQRPKKCIRKRLSKYFSSACEYVKLPFSLRVPKIADYINKSRSESFCAKPRD
jgi:hypothetical protein